MGFYLYARVLSYEDKWEGKTTLCVVTSRQENGTQRNSSSNFLSPTLDVVDILCCMNMLSEGILVYLFICMFCDDMSG